MREQLVQFDTVVRTEDGRGYIPSAWGGPMGDLWEGWIEFEPVDANEERLQSEHETEQATRDALLYWAEGLTNVYLEGALERALGLGRVDEGESRRVRSRLPDGDARE